MNDKMLCNLRQRGLSLPVLLAVGGLVALIGWRLAGRVQAQTDLQRQTGDLAVPTVAVIHPAPGGAAQDLVLPGTVQAWADAPIYARTGGYLRRWYVDIGQHVKAGQLLAEIETPEVDQQLRQAEADLATTETTSKLAQTTADRYRQLIDTHAVSAQDAEDKIGDAQAKRTAVASARANVLRLREIQGFKRVVAPFDGVVTARNVDIGALVVAGGASGQALFRVADTRKLRVYVEVPEGLAGSIGLQQPAELQLQALPHQRFAARVASTSTSINAASRSLLVQLDLDNAKGEVLPGSYAEVHFKQAPRNDVLRVPGNTLLFRGDGLSVAVVDPHNRIVIRPVVQGRDFGKEVEILDGLQPDDRVIVNPSDSAVTGMPVKVAAATTKPAAR